MVGAGTIPPGSFLLSEASRFWGGLWIPRISQRAMVRLAFVLLEASYANLSHPPIAQAVRPTLSLALPAALVVTQRMSRGNVLPAG